MVDMTYSETKKMFCNYVFNVTVFFARKKLFETGNKTAEVVSDITPVLLILKEQLF